MKKRGQISIFVIVGIILVILFSLIFIYRENLSETFRQEALDPEKYLAQQLGDVKKEIGRCVNQETNSAAKILMEHAGVFERDFGYISYYSKKYSILCKEFEDDTGCLAEPLSIESMEKKLNSRIKEKTLGCVNFPVDKDYEIESGDMEVNTKILDQNIIVSLNYNVELVKGVTHVKDSNFVFDVENPLGELTRVTNQLIQNRARGLIIDPLGFDLLNKNKYNLEVKKPYPDELYDLSLTTNDNFHFYFAVEGKGRNREAVVN